MDPKQQPTFSDFQLLEPIQKTLSSLGFTQPTDIQRKTFPILLDEHPIDFHGQAQTGTGKTLAFGIPLLHRIDPASKKVQALVVAPTRELAVQIKDSLKPFAQALGLSLEAIYGGVSMDAQTHALKRGCHIVVGTPGRVHDHMRRRHLSLTHLSTVVLDEADIMLDMGFKEEVETILSFAPPTREIWLFSATVKKGIADLMQSHMREPVSVRVSKKQVATSTTKQYFCVAPMRNRMQALSRFIESSPDFYGFIFCQTKILTSDVAEKLIKLGFNVGALHGDMSQAQRNLVIKKFKARTITIVVATDVAARGIDIADLTHVINYSIPEDHESYIHRIGRTGRAGKEGTAITLVSRSELRRVTYLQEKFKTSIEPIDVPDRDTIVKARLQEASRYIAQLSDHVAPETMSKADQALEALINDLTPDEHRVVLARVLKDKFLSTLGPEDVSFTPSSKVSFPDDAQEIFMNVGSDDGVTYDDIMACIVDTGTVERDQIHKIRVIKRRSFIHLPGECIQKVMQSLRGAHFGGRRVRVSIAEERRQDRPRHRSHGRRKY